MARIGLGSNVKFRRLARTLNSAALARGILELLWEPCYETGDPYIGTAEDIEAVVGWTGPAGVLTQALLDAGADKGAGFIESYASPMAGTKVPHYQIHDFFHHCPDYAKVRGERERERQERSNERKCVRCNEPYHSRDPRKRFCGTTCRVAAWRALHSEEATHKNIGNSRESNAVKRMIRNEDDTPTPTPTRTYVQNVQRKDQERLPGDADALRAAVTQNAERADSSQPNLLGEVRAPDEVLDAEAPVLEFPIDGVAPKSTRKTWPLMQRQIDKWAQAYETLDIPRECRRALEWVEANPSNRKTYGGMPAFLVRWFSKSINTRARAPTSYSKSAGNVEAARQWLRERAVKS